jgi:hypothetical protein
LTQDLRKGDGLRGFRGYLFGAGADAPVTSLRNQPRCCRSGVQFLRQSPNIHAFWIRFGIPVRSTKDKSMRKSAKIISAVAVAGLAFAASAAFTGAGLANNAGGSQFVGGQVSQTVTGATLSTVTYNFTDPAKTTLTSVTLGFADAEGEQVSLVLASAEGTAFTCTVITSGVSTCTSATAVTGVTGATITVA